MTAKITGHTLLLVLLASFAIQSTEAQQDPKFPQSWQGELDAKVAVLRIRFDIEKEGDKTKCLMTSLDQGNVKMAMDDCEIEDQKVTMTLERMKIKFEGTYNEKQTELNGTFTQAGREFPLNLKSIDPPKKMKHLENWNGTMKAGDQEFKFQFRVMETNDKKRVVRLDSLSEGLADLEVDAKYDDQDVEFVIKISAAKFVGTFNEERNKISGNWIQRGNEIPLELTKTAVEKTKSVEPPKRPQTPKEPFPYLSEDVSFENPTDEITLAGTLTTPKSGTNFPAAVLITGSGPQDRDETLLGHKPFLVIADHLTRSGVAVLRYDERGIGKSTGKFQGANSEDLSRDVEAAIEFLKKQRGVDVEKIGLIGHSEGGYIAPMLAAKRSDIAFIVMLAGPGVTGEKVIIDQAELIGRASGIADEDLELNKKVQETIFGAIRDVDDSEVESAVSNALDKLIATLPDGKNKDELIKEKDKAGKTFKDPWFRFFLTYDPGPSLEKVKCPTLVLNGEKDLQVSPDLNLPPIKKALEAGENPNFEIHRLPNLNHLFQTCETGSPSEYSKITETFSPTALNLISNWIDENVK